MSDRDTIIGFADQYLAPYRLKDTPSGTEVIPDLCPFCHGGASKDKHTFALSIDLGVYVCKRGSCGVRGTFSSLAKQLSGKEIRTSTNMKHRKEPKDYVLPDDEIVEPTIQIYEYFKKRGISTSTVDAMKVGATKDGMICFRFYENGVDVYHKYRRPWKPNEEEKKKKEWQLSGTKPILFNMDNCVFSQPLVITEGECFPGDAEVLTPNGWVRLDKYNNEPVLAVDEDFKGCFEIPYAYVKKKYCGDMVTMSVRNTYYSQTTSNHNIVTTHETPNKHVKIVSKHKACEELPAREYIPRTSIVSGNGIDLTNDQIALYLAVSADCTIDITKTTRHCRFGVKKERKYTRMKKLLDNLGIEYFDNPKASHGYYYIGFRTPDWIESKELPMSWVCDATYAQRRFILDEMTYWDGNSVKGRSQIEYSSCNKNNALLMQTLAHTCGYVASLKTKKRDNEKHSTLYVVPIYLNKTRTGCQGINNSDHKQTTKYSGNVYCVSVSTGMILVKQHECITITGNCDAMAIYEAGIHNVVSVPSGCDNVEWVTLCYDWLEHFNSIILFGDNDAPGQRMVQTLVKRLGEYRTKTIDPMDYPTIKPDSEVQCKDADEILVRIGPMKIIEMVEGAKEQNIKGLLDLGKVKPVDPSSIPCIKTNIPALDLYLGGLAEGSVTISTGKSGAGKSTIAGMFLLNAVEQGHNVCAYSGELSATLFQNWLNMQAAGSEWIGLRYSKVRDTMVPCLSREVEQRIVNWYSGHIFLFDNKEIFETKQAESIIEMFTVAVRKYNCKLFLVDNVMTSLCDVDGEELKAQTRFINALKKFADRYNVHVLVVAHPRKTKKDERIGSDDVAGSSNLVNMCDSAFVVERPDIRILKNRMNGQQVLIPCAYCGDSRRIYQADRGDLNKFSWDRTGLKRPDVLACSLPEYGITLSDNNNGPF